MNDKPILFNTDMVCALLDGRKTQTRRIVKPQPEHRENESLPGEFGTFFHGWNLDHPAMSIKDILQYCPYGKPGDLLWVRESAINHSILKAHGSKRYMDVKYVADESVTRDVRYPSRLARPILDHKMPNGCYREASRLTLRITNVRVERVQDISEENARAEGAESYDVSTLSDDEIFLLDAPVLNRSTPYKNGFSMLWDSVNGPDAWDRNDWVWVIEFEVIKQNVDEI